MERELRWKTVSPGYEVSDSFRTLTIQQGENAYTLCRAGAVLGRYATAEEAKASAARFVSTNKRKT